MNYTENYHLPQWEETDRIMRVDFNEAMAGIEEGMAAAQATADAAAVLPYVIGFYMGDGTTFNKITLGFQPSAVLVSERYSTDIPTEFPGNCSLFIQAGDAGHLLILEDGFYAEQTRKYPYINRKGMSYQYIAFR